MVRHEEIALLRMVAHRIAGPGEADVVAAARLMTATQGQHLPGALTSLALRARDATKADVVSALDHGRLVRSWPMRGTLHIVAAEDLRWLLSLLAERVLAQMARRRQQLGLDEATLARARASTQAALRGGHGLLRKDLIAVWEDEGLAPAGGRGYHMLANLSLNGVVCHGPSDGDDQRIVLMDEWIPTGPIPDREETLAWLAERYFHGHGPATETDFARWAGLPLRDVRVGIAAVGDRLESITGPEAGSPRYLMAPDTAERLERHRAEARGVFLLPGFDEYILGYADRDAVLPPEFAARIVPGNNGVFRPTVVAAGRVVGTWRFPTRQKRSLEAEPFTAFAPEVSARLPDAYATLPV
ncbi:AlkZ family DNA glycosylase [Spiractinospora alimapuensis]|uniref:winged helix DNA-binding domain-containing protein n=1 Tax=Spiractinospora alimapuensis TaxID=2820884 RepID=UPI001F22C652|nr:winged helix DNA-binding domain-containing protein [Spiractinospora alimapuensis]QVQ50280.1 AlkZ family DNA glycosylase [Spiractinospora alimapuensis]